MKDITGSFFALDVRASDTVDHVKAIVHEREGIPLERFALQAFVLTERGACVAVTTEHGDCINQLR